MLMKLFRALKCFNRYENKKLTSDFRARVKSIKVKNSQAVWTHYYIPNAMWQVYKEDNYLGINPKVENLASANMFNDLASGKLDEFYRFRK